MDVWPKQPLVYEINTRVWLDALSRREGRAVTLANVPPEEWDALAALGMDAVWLMGVWERSPAGVRIAREHSGLREDYRRVLPDFSDEDVVGSPYCVRRYVVDEGLGGPEALQAARSALLQRGMKLMLDFVPNHVATDHPWIKEHPEYFIQSRNESSAPEPHAFFQAGGRRIAHGRDPHFPPWTDTAQLNAFHAGHRRASAETVLSIAGQCDGVRCDMAMLLLDDVFRKTWGELAGQGPDEEYWEDLIGSVRRKHPEFCFMAEAYWDLEWKLHELGFDFCYDKRLYDRLVCGDAEPVRLHLLADMSYQEGLVRFLENHDEPRAASVFSPEKERAAAVVVFTTPGAKLIHEGQLEGRRTRIPVQLGRRPCESVDQERREFYSELLEVLRLRPLNQKSWRMCMVCGWPDNPSFGNLLAWCWETAGEAVLVVVNYSDLRSQGRVRIPGAALKDKSWRLRELLTSEAYRRDGTEICDPGLFVDLGPWKFHFMVLESC